MKTKVGKILVFAVVPLTLASCGGKYITREAALLMLNDIAVSQQSDTFTIPFDLSLTYAISTYTDNEVKNVSYIVDVSKSMDFLHYKSYIDGETQEVYQYQRNGLYYYSISENGIPQHTINEAATETQIKDLAGIVSYSVMLVTAIVSKYSSPTVYNEYLGCSIVEEISKIDFPVPSHSYKETYNAKGVGSLEGEIGTYITLDGSNQSISTMKFGYTNNFLTSLSITKNLAFSFVLGVKYGYVPVYPTVDIE